MPLYLLSVIVCLCFLLDIQIFMEISAFSFKIHLLKIYARYVKRNIQNKKHLFAGILVNFCRYPNSYALYFFYLTFSNECISRSDTQPKLKGLMQRLLELCSCQHDVGVFHFKPRVLSSFVGEALVCCPPHRADRVFASFLRGPCQRFIR